MNIFYKRKMVKTLSKIEYHTKMKCVDVGESVGKKNMKWFEVGL